MCINNKWFRKAEKKSEKPKQTKCNEAHRAFGFKFQIN